MKETLPKFGASLSIIVLLFPNVSIMEPDAGSLEYRVLAFPFLGHVIVQRFDGDTAETEHGQDVHHGHTGHQNIGHIPSDFQVCICTDKYHHYGQNSRHSEKQLIFTDKFNVELRIKVIPDERCKGEQRYRDSNDTYAHLSKHGLHRLLHERNSVQLAADCILPCAEYDEHGR